MELHTILKNVDNLDGPILDIGFGKGKFSDLMLNYILSNTTTLLILYTHRINNK